MSLTKTIYNKEEGTQVHSRAGMPHPSSDVDQILHLKRLIVTLKQQYEKGLHHLNDQLHLEQKKCISLATKLELSDNEQKALKKHHEEEVHSLRKQIIGLRDASKAKIVEMPTEELQEGRQRIEQLERVIPYLRERTNEAKLETEQLRELLMEVQKKNVELARKCQLSEEQVKNENYHFQETHVLHPEKANEATFGHISEVRYLEILNQKVSLEYKMEQQSLAISAVQEKLQSLEKEKSTLEAHLESQSSQLEEVVKERLELIQQIENLKAELSKHSDKLQTEVSDQDHQKQTLQLRLDEKNTHCEELLKERSQLQNQIEQLQNEKNQLVEGQTHIQEAQSTTEQKTAALEEKLEEQLLLVNEKVNQISALHQKKEALEESLQAQKSRLDESELNLKIAQQHLAKKVKEGALFNEKVEQLQHNLNEYARTVDNCKAQIFQLHTAIEQYQNQENKLQNEVRDTVKNSELQIAKWEEKYFKLYDKWQEADLQVRELQKIEEKYQHVQTILSNLSTHISSPSKTSVELVENTPPTAHFFGEGAFLEDQSDYSNGHFDLFGMQINKPKS